MAMESPLQLLVFRLDGQHYALHLAVVERVARAVEITRLPDAPGVVLGIINVGGSLVPVFNVRCRFGLEERDVKLSDQFIVARASRRAVALVADAIVGVVESARAAMTAASRILPGLAHVEGVLKLADGLVLIHDLETFLSLDETKSLERALAAR